MKNENVRVLSDANFKRAVGVQRDIFNVMLEAIKKNIRNFDRPPKFSRADQLLMTLMSGVNTGLSSMSEFLMESAGQLHAGQSKRLKI